MNVEKIVATGSQLLWRRAIAILLAVGVFGEAIFAGAMLSGASWAQAAHSLNAKILIAGTGVAAAVTIVTLRHVPGERKRGWVLATVAVLFFLQAALGALSAKGANLLWMHIPLGVALFGFAAHGAIENLRPRS